MTVPTPQGPAGAEGVLPASGQVGAEVKGFALLGEVLTSPEVFDPAAEPGVAMPAESPSVEVKPILAALPDSGPLQSAEQLLLSVLGQRQVRLEARESEQEEQEPADPQVDGAVPMLPAELLARLPQPGPDQSAPAAVQILPQAPRVDAAGSPLVGPGPVAETLSTSFTDTAEVLAAIDGTAPANLADSDLLRGLGRTQAPVQVDAAPAPTLERHLKLQAPEAKWGEQMLGALRDSVELQLQQKTQSATIRLDPPELGSLEILLSHDAGRLTVQISAAQGDVARLLQQTSERLRQELVGQNFLQVNVQVGGDAQSGQQRQQQSHWRQAQDEPVTQALRLDSGENGARQRADDVLITV